MLPKHRQMPCAGQETLKLGLLLIILTQIINAVIRKSLYCNKKILISNHCLLVNIKVELCVLVKFLKTKSFYYGYLRISLCKNQIAGPYNRSRYLIYNHAKFVKDLNCFHT